MSAKIGTEITTSITMAKDAANFILLADMILVSLRKSLKRFVIGLYQAGTPVGSVIGAQELL